MSKAPVPPGPISYLTATVTGTVCATLIVLRLGTYAAGIGLGREVNAITFVAATVFGVLSMALFWRIDRRWRSIESDERARQERWTGYGQAAQDLFNPPADTDDTLDLLRI